MIKNTKSKCEKLQLGELYFVLAALICAEDIY